MRPVTPFLTILRTDRRLRVLDMVTPQSRESGGGAIGSGTGLAYIRVRISEAFGGGTTVTTGPMGGSRWRTTIVMAASP